MVWKMCKYFLPAGGISKFWKHGNKPLFPIVAHVVSKTWKQAPNFGNIGNRHNVGWKHFGNTIELRINKLLNNNKMETFWIQRNLALSLTHCFRVSKKIGVG